MSNTLTERQFAEYVERSTADLQHWKDRAETTEAALKGLIGLVQLVRSRDDCPVGIKQALTNQYRLDDAFAALEAKP